MNPSAWIFSHRFDCCFILAPALLVSFAAILAQQFAPMPGALPPWLWLLLVVGVDAGHVYATLFRTYLVKDELTQRHTLLVLAPLLAWLLGCLLYSIDGLLFWRVLAYLAVFHFIRQQYGFMMLYGRHERAVPQSYRRLDQAAIYAATLYPLVYWHCTHRSFDWFIEGDFVLFDAPSVATVAALLYALLLVAYAIKEIKLWRNRHGFNVPRNLWLLGTALSWQVGIVAFDNDLVFTACNVLAHGIPYLALTWGYGRNQSRMQTAKAYIAPWLARLFSYKTVPLYVGLVFMLAYVEEGFWDGLVWREHAHWFGLFQDLPTVTSPQTLAWLVPLLSLPQATHYVLDAFIWRLHDKKTHWKEILFYRAGKDAAVLHGS